MTSQTVTEGLGDLMAAVAAADAFRQQDRDGVINAMKAITPGRAGEALLALTVVAIDQAARATGQPWTAVADVIITALMDPDERQQIENQIKEMNGEH